ncbi:MAG TPA: sensor histidine kinase [Streptosporangiaceae bacterium]|jgi:anti-sigma regulatory factor (Ser/Thr protein kinase)
MTPGHNGLVHQALVYDGEQEFLAAATPFLRAGLAAGSAMLAVVPRPRIDALRAELGADGADVQFVDAVGWYQHPVRTIAAYDAFLRAHAPKPVCALTEPFCQDRSPLETVEWIRYEAIVNAAFGASGAAAMCAYNRYAVPDDVIAEARRTHPEVVEDGTPQPSHGYTDPGRVSADCDRTALPLPPRYSSMPIVSEDMHDVRRFVADCAAEYGLPSGGLSTLLVAVTEVATNAVKHGTPPMAVRMWAADGDLICEVADCGYWRPGDLLGFLPPASAAAGGFGLWGVRMLTDLVQIRTSWDGTVVRLRVKL